MSQPTDIPNPFDPLGFWRTTQNASLEAWSKAMIELVNTDAYAEATGRMLDSYFAASVPMRKIVEQAMTQILGQINMPTRAEVLSIAERMTNIELRLDDLDARFDVLQRMLSQIAGSIASIASGANGASTSQPQTATAAATRRPARSATSTAAEESRPSASTTTSRTQRTQATQATVAKNAGNASNATRRTTAAARSKE